MASQGCWRAAAFAGGLVRRGEGQRERKERERGEERIGER